MRCAICQKAACVCGCEQWENDDDAGEWTPAPLPLWFVSGLWFFGGVVCGILIAAKNASGN